MSVNLEQLETLKQRANISYAEAKEVLEKCNNDIVEALIYLESQSKVKTTPRFEELEYGFSGTLKKITKTAEKLFKKGNEIKFVIKKAEKIVLNLPLNMVIITTVIVPFITIIGVLLALATNHKIRLIKPDGGKMEINDTFDKISSKVNAMSSKVVEVVKE